MLPVSGKPNLPELEEQVLARWKERGIFKKSLERRKGQPEFVFYEGPPTANAKPALHHVIGRVFKDVIPRYKAMRGFHVPRRAGWDTHGLPVEIAVEKELGIKSKPEIEVYGVAAFNAKARESVWQYKADWEKLTERIGFWLDMETPYITYDNAYIEGVWGVLKAVHERGFLYKGHKVVPWCSRCGTALASHELAQGYKEVTDTAVYTRFKIEDVRFKNTSVLVWTTTPWTLPGNVALAVNPAHQFVKVKDAEGFLILEKSAAERLGFDVASAEVVAAKDLIGLSYEPLFNVAPLKSEKSYKIYPAEFVTAGEGTGVVHTAVMYGEDDYALGVSLGLPQAHTVDEAGNFTSAVSGFAGMRAKNKTTEEKIIAYLTERGSLSKAEQYAHDYPFCWRCDTPVIYYATNSWFIAMSKLRAQLQKANAGVSWKPEHIRDGRFGEWLKEAKDWALSRARYWGTPLPVWECACGHYEVVGSIEDLRASAYIQNIVYGIRHGEADHTVQNIIACDDAVFESHLTPLGREQIRASAEKLKDKKIVAIYCSPFARTRETAEIIQSRCGAPIHYDERLGEVNLGVFNNKDPKEYQGILGDKSADEAYAFVPEGGESRIQVMKRVIECMDEIRGKHKGESVVIVSHGDPLLMLAIGVGSVSRSEHKMNDIFGLGELHEIKANSTPCNASHDLDAHRPFIDEVFLRCSHCDGGKMTRVKEVCDVWLDSGAMPFVLGEHPSRYPADYICEAIDQTRGWFYTLLAVATVLGHEAPYKNVVCYSHLLDKNGKKMSKSRGNIVEPWELIGRHGIDALRWYFYTSAIVREPQKFDEEDVVKNARGLISLIYNSYSFLATYSDGVEVAGEKNILDEWIEARLHETIVSATKDLDAYEIGDAARAIESFANDLSRWYLRRSRKRVEALPVLRRMLLELSKLIAPFMPFFADALYLSLGGKEESVHLEDWPKPDAFDASDVLIAGMAEVRRVASDALALRADLKIKVRQPLASLTILNPKSTIMHHADLLEILKDEVNVKEVLFIIEGEELPVLRSSESVGVKLDIIITPELKTEGIYRDLVRMAQGLRQSAGFVPADKAVFVTDVAGEAKDALEAMRESFMSSTGASDILFTEVSDCVAEAEEEIAGTPQVRMGIRK